MSNLVDMTENNEPPQSATLDDGKLAYRLPAAAALMDLTIWELRGLIRVGEIAYIKVGKRFIVSRTEIKRFLAEREEKQSA